MADAQIKGMILQKALKEDDKTMEVLLVAAPNDMVRNMQEVIKLANIQPVAIDLEPFALLQALQRNLDATPAHPDYRPHQPGSQLLFDQHLQERCVLRHNRTISVAGNSFTKAIGQSLNLSFEEAEKIKKEKGVIRVEKDTTPVAPTTMRIFNCRSCAGVDGTGDRDPSLL